MKISRMKFTPIVVAEIIIILIFIPITIIIWQKGFRDMAYYKNFSNAVNCYLSKDLATVKISIKKTQESKPNEIYPYLLEAKTFLDENNISSAKKTYQNVISLSDYSKIGLIICGLYESEEIENPDARFDYLNKEVYNLINDFLDIEEFPDLLITLGHIYLSYADCFLQKQDFSKIEDYIDKAMSKFNRAEKKSKEMYIPSLEACASMYIGKSKAYYMRSLLQNKNTKEAKKQEFILNNLEKSIEYMKKFLLYRIPNKEAAETMDFLYGTILSLDYISEDKRIEIMKDADKFLDDNKKVIKAYKARNLEGIKEKFWENYQKINFGKALSFYYMNDLLKAKDFFKFSINASPSVVKGCILQLEYEIAEKNENKKVAFRNIQYNYERNLNLIKNNQKNIKFNEIFTIQDFINFNNAISLLYYTQNDKKALLDNAELLRKAIEYFPDCKFELNTRPSHVSAKRIALNNLYYLFKKINDKDLMNRFSIHRVGKK